MIDYRIELKQVIKFFGRRLIFHGIDYTFTPGNVYGIAGPNGSGKSTIVKIISGLISPTKGKVVHFQNGKEIQSDQLHNHMGFVSPYLFLYDEFTAEENLIHSAKIRGLKFQPDYSNSLLNEFGLLERKNDLVRGYSSGMKQRLKYAFALLHQPELLILDEPTSNLDNSGKEKVYNMIERERKNRLILVASNEDSDLALCGNTLELEKFKTKLATK
jgi:heme exporter protein A